MTRPGPRTPLLLALAALATLAAPGCSLLLPEVHHQPVVHNPFPQLSRVAVVPFFNQSGEPTVDGRQFASAYFAELQAVPGFEVVPVSAVEVAIRQQGIRFDPPADVVSELRRLAAALGVDAVVVGTVTDYSPYYPPRCGMRVEWYAANAGFHAIPAGYGLPWGTPEEEFIPDRLVFEAEMELARAQMATQSPTVETEVMSKSATKSAPAHESGATPLAPMRDPAPLMPTPDEPDDVFEEDGSPGQGAEALPAPGEDVPSPMDDANEDPDAGNPLRQATFEAPIDETDPMTAPAVTGGATAAGVMTPPGWPDARGFTPPGPVMQRPNATPNPGPVMTHTALYRGNDTEFTAALAAYVGFRDDARFGGWQSYLTRSEDFIRFCCHLHVVETLTARGGGSETRVVRRWSASR